MVSLIVQTQLNNTFPWYFHINFQVLQKGSCQYQNKSHYKTAKCANQIQIPRRQRLSSTKTARITSLQ
jgi:hypothetical protein